MRGKVIALLLIGFVVWAPNRASAAPVVLSLESKNGSVGNNIEFALNISGLGGGTALGVFDLTLAFDPTIIAFASVAYGDPVLGDQLNLGGFGTVALTTPGVGSVELFDLSLDSADVLASRQADNFTLAVLTFAALAAGQTPLNISILALGDQFGRSIGVSTQSGNAVVNQPPVPEPGTLLLLGSALIGLAAARFKYRRRSP